MDLPVSHSAADTHVVRRPAHPAARDIAADICVVGSGIAGLSAALEAARLGRSVILVDSLPVIGGQAVHSQIGVFCGLLSNPPRNAQLTHGIADDILRDLGAEGALHRIQGGLGSIIYDPLALGRWAERAVDAAGITAVTGTIVRAVARDGRRITALDCATKFGDLRVRATGFVDASGDAILTWLAGEPCRVPGQGPVYGTHILVVEGVDARHLPSREALVERQRRCAGDYGLTRTDGLVLTFLEKGLAFINMTHDETPLEAVAAAKAGFVGRDRADVALRFLKREFPDAFGQVRVRAYGLPGVRQTRWIVGVHQLTAAEILAGHRFDDAIGRTAWPIELHGSDAGYEWRVFPPDHLHYIPLRSLVPPGLDNLVAAGRCVDADTQALSSIRVQGPCIAMGAAAAHALDLADGGSVHEIDSARLGARLVANLDGLAPVAAAPVAAAP
jgi:hypothetical protein